MPFVQVKCPDCGEELTIDDAKLNWKCQRCGSVFNVSYAVNRSGANQEFVSTNGILTKYHGSAEEVFIPDNIVRIGDHAFENNKNITMVIMPESVSSIGEYAFLGCTGLRTVIIPRIGFSNNFQKASGGKSILETVDKFQREAQQKGVLGTVMDMIANNVKSKYCIENGAFGGCTNLTSLELNTEAEQTDRLIALHPEAFSGCMNLSYIRIGKSIRMLPDRIFDCCDNTVRIEWNYLSLYPNCCDDVRERLRQNRCLCCGGEFKGFFTKKCKDCGRPKDYN